MIPSRRIPSRASCVVIPKGRSSTSHPFLAMIACSFVLMAVSGCGGGGSGATSGTNSAADPSLVLTDAGSLQGVKSDDVVSSRASPLPRLRLATCGGGLPRPWRPGVRFARPTAAQLDLIQPLNEQNLVVNAQYGR